MYHVYILIYHCRLPRNQSFSHVVIFMVSYKNDQVKNVQDKNVQGKNARKIKIVNSVNVSVLKI
ncbi:hypothetical protein QTP88_028569 [Uroleucon formosanum]